MVRGVVAAGHLVKEALTQRCHEIILRVRLGRTGPEDAIFREMRKGNCYNSESPLSPAERVGSTTKLCGAGGQKAVEQEDR
jgi:hypothetical protein